MFHTCSLEVVGTVGLRQRWGVVVLGRDSRDRLRLVRLVFGSGSRSGGRNGCLVLALLVHLLFDSALIACDSSRRSSTSGLGQSGLRLRVLASSERVSRRDFRGSVGLAGSVGLLVLLLSSLSLLFLLLALLVGPQQVLEEAFGLGESIGSY